MQRCLIIRVTMRTIADAGLQYHQFHQLAVIPAIRPQPRRRRLRQTSPPKRLRRPVPQPPRPPVRRWRSRSKRRPGRLLQRAARRRLLDTSRAQPRLFRASVLWTLIGSNVSNGSRPWQHGPNSAISTQADVHLKRGACQPSRHSLLQAPPLPEAGGPRTSAPPQSRPPTDMARSAPRSRRPRSRARCSRTACPRSGSPSQAPIVGLTAVPVSSGRRPTRARPAARHGTA